MMLRIAAFTILVFGISGCMLGPDYRRPSVESPPSWRFEDTQAREAADTSWWKQFGDPVLDGLIETALAENKDVRIAAARIEEYMGRYAFARSALFPQIGAQASIGRERNSEVGFVPLPSTVRNPNDLYNASIFASWEIDLWGKLRRGAEAARAELLGTREAKRSVILSLVTSVSAAYVNLLSLDRQLEITRGTVNSRQGSYRIFQLRFEHGFASELERYQAKSEYEAALATVPLIEKSIAQQEHAISLLLGRNPGPVKRGRTMGELGLPAVPAGLPSSLLERRPDIRQAEQTLIAANARIGIARAQYFPSISLTGLFGWESTDLSNLFTGPARTWNWTVPLTQPLFNWGAFSGQVKEAEALREEALLQYQAAIQRAFGDVEDALIDQRSTREQLGTLSRQVADLREYARIARLRYDNGYANYIEVLDAERSLFTADLGRTQTHAVLFQALINLYKAMGGGWISAADERSSKSSKEPGTGIAGK
jgi:outer membrane protein, multidrug efflux system